MQENVQSQSQTIGLRAEAGLEVSYKTCIMKIYNLVLFI